MTRCFRCFAFVLIGLLHASPANGLVKGRVTNETHSRPQRDCVVLLIRQATEPEIVGQDTTDEDGRFAFQDADGDDAIWFLSAAYAGVNYVQRLSDGLNEFAVYETTDSDTALTVVSHHIIVDAAEKRVEQILIVRNDGNRTFRTGEGHGHGLEVLLPDGVTEVRDGPQGLHTHGPILVNPDPVRPGHSQLLFAFDLPASGRLSQTLSYPTGTVDVFVRPADAEVAAGALQDRGEVTFEQHNFRRFSGAGFNRGDRIDLGINTSSWSLSALWGDADVKWVLLGLAIGFLLLAVFFRIPGKTGSPSRAPAGGPPDLEARRNALMHQIADMDDRYEQGRLPEEEYQTRRNALKAELVDMTRVLDGEA
ncbi:MAG: hypothetical protein OXU79_04950 [Gemmatimonadota bacterium]|nr:hypothetical protein [Gemmatimonadota bacterium]